MGQNEFQNVNRYAQSCIQNQINMISMFANKAELIEMKKKSRKILLQKTHQKFQDRTKQLLFIPNQP